MPKDKQDKSATKEGTNSDGTDALKGASIGASYNVALQLGFRILTFIVNAVIIRFSSSALLGVVNVRLTLLYSTILFISREPFRKALLSISEKELGDPKLARSVINTSWMVLPVGSITALILGLVWTTMLEIPDMNGYAVAVASYAVSAVVELLAEPLWVLGQIHSQFKFKVLAEGLSLSLRCLASVGLLVSVPDIGLYGFSIAQVVSSILLVIVYYGALANNVSNGKIYLSLASVKDVLPQKQQHSAAAFWFLDLPSEMTSRVINFWKQSILKQFLTEGEGYLMTFLGLLTFSEQGVYTVVNNLGSLVARFLFAPIEETFFTYFAGKLSVINVDSGTLKKRIIEAAKTLQTLGKFVLLIALTIAVFAQPYSSLLLELYGGSWLSEGEGPKLLRTYSAYVLLLAANGITECFMTASMTNTQVERHNLWMIGFTVIFLVASSILTQQLGAVGFILANCVNMLVRIARSSYMITTFLKEYNCQLNPLVTAWPSNIVLLAYVVALVTGLVSEMYFCCSMKMKICHVAVGIVTLGAVATSIFVKENAFLRDFKNDLFGHRKQ